jgi:hypothetical protein
MDKNKNNASEMDLKRKLIEATDSVRKKFNYIKNRYVENQMALEKIYEPLTKPLKTISEATQETNRKFQSTQQYLPTPPKKTTAYSATMTKTPKFEAAQSIIETPAFMETPPSSVVTPSSSRASTTSLEKLPRIVSNYIDGIKAGESGFDTKYGVRIDIDTGKLAMGNSEVRFQGKT